MNDEFHAVLYSGDYGLSDWGAPDEHGWREVLLMTRDGRTLTGLIREPWTMKEEVQSLGVVKQPDVIAEKQAQAAQFLQALEIEKEANSEHIRTVDIGTDFQRRMSRLSQEANGLSGESSTKPVNP